jgi:ribosomal protein S27AE
VLKREPCSKCGEKIAEKHHHDYSKPLDVTWLCRKCHMQEHKRMEMA